MGNYSKIIGAVVGALMSFLVTKFALPAEWASAEFSATITGVIMSALVYIFPANQSAA